MASELGIVEQYRSMRLRRLEIQREADNLEKEEKKLKEQIIEELRKGTPHRGVILITKQKPTVTDWTLLYEHIRSTGEFDLMQRRVTESAVQERWQDGANVPGVERFPVYDIKVG